MKSKMYDWLSVGLTDKLIVEIGQFGWLNQHFFIPLVEKTVYLWANGQLKRKLAQTLMV